MQASVIAKLQPMYIMSHTPMPVLILPWTFKYKQFVTDTNNINTTLTNFSFTVYTGCNTPRSENTFYFWYIFSNNSVIISQFDKLTAKTLQQSTTI